MLLLVQMLDYEVDEVEKQGFKMLDDIAQRISRQGFESLRNLKSTLNKLMLRTGRIKEASFKLTELLILPRMLSVKHWKDFTHMIVFEVCLLRVAVILMPYR